MTSKLKSKSTSKYNTTTKTRKRSKSISKHSRKSKSKSKSNRKIKHKSRFSTPTKFKAAQCAPKSPQDKDQTLPYTCYTKDALEKMRQAWNARHPDCPITSTEPHTIWSKLKQNMSSTCNAESCWLKQHFIKNKLGKDLLNYTFAPKYPDKWKENPDEWLNSLDILAVMKQYEKRFPCFDFIGPSPIDYDTHMLDGECVWQELCEFNLQKHMQNGKNKVGIIFNLDPHYKEGSHWVSLFINIKKSEINYFDSYGEAPEKQIVKFMNDIVKQGKRIGMTFTKNINKKRHQFSDSECGMYSLYVIIQQLHDKPFKTLSGGKISDKHMLSLRKKYFNVY
jgi:hypothetical protein